MAKGDSGRAQNQISYQGGLSQNTLNNTRDVTAPLQQSSTENYARGSDRSFQNYDQLMDYYRNFLGSNSPVSPMNPYAPSSNGTNGNGVDGSASSIESFLKSHGGTGAETNYWVGKWPELMERGRQLGDPNYAMKRLSQAEELGGGGGNQQGPAFGGYEQFAQTGGFSPADIQNMRARAIAPTRAIYQNAQNELSRQRALQGGYAPNFAAAQSRLARDASNQISDIGVNTEANLAQLIQSGKLAGLGGMQQGDQFGRNLGLQYGQLGQQGDLANRQLNLGGINAMTSLYGQQPGLAALYGNQALGANAQGIDIQQLQNQLGLGMIGQQINKSQIPGNFQQALGNIGGVLNLGGQVAGMMGGLPTGMRMPQVTNGIMGGGAGMLTNAGMSGLPGGTTGYF